VISKYALPNAHELGQLHKIHGYYGAFNALSMIHSRIAMNFMPINLEIEIRVGHPM
jgi:hypothetical protein